MIERDDLAGADAHGFIPHHLLPIIPWLVVRKTALTELRLLLHRLLGDADTFVMRTNQPEFFIRHIPAHPKLLQQAEHGVQRARAIIQMEAAHLAVSALAVE